MKNPNIKININNCSILQISHEIYKINYNVKDCELPKSHYMSQTQDSISGRMTEYLKMAY